MVRKFCAFTLSALAIMFSVQAQAGTKVSQSFKLKNVGFSATFFGAETTDIVDGQSCGRAVQMNVFYSEMNTRTDGVNDSTPPVTFVEIDYQNSCLGQAFFLSGAVIAPQQTTVRGDSGAATLISSIPVSNDDGSVTTTVYLNLQWTATGPAVSFREKINSNEGGVKFKLDSKSEGRPADVTGTATAVMPVSGNVSLILAPSVGGSINRNNLGLVTVTHTKN